MKQLKQYIIKTLGVDIDLNPLPKGKLGNLPLFLAETYHLYEAKLFDHTFILVEKSHPDGFSILQMDKHFQIIKEAFHTTVVLLINELASYNQKRLIDKRINFILPGKLLFLPDMLIDIKENFASHKKKQKTNSLLPSAQLLILYHILIRDKTIEERSFKELSRLFYYTPMVITNAVENLKHHEICTTVGEKEKYIKFNLDRPKMWHDFEKRNLLVSPVIKRVFVDEKPQNVFMLHSNTSALPEYSDMNPSRQKFYAIEKTAFYKLQKDRQLINLNESEGKYCLEVWKYNNMALAQHLNNNMNVVDPLSLYLSLKDTPDERIQDALEQIIKKHVW